MSKLKYCHYGKHNFVGRGTTTCQSCLMEIFERQTDRAQEKKWDKTEVKKAPVDNSS